MTNLKSILIYLLLSTSFLAHTQNITRPNISAPSDLEVNAFTGNLFHKRAEFSIPGQGLDLETMFSYNASLHTKNTGYGNGWSFNYGVHYRVGSDNMILIERSDGRLDTFRLEAGTLYLPSSGVFDILEEYESNRYRLTTKFGRQYYFDNAAHRCLTSIKDRNGNEIQLSYTGNRLTTVSDVSGRNLTLVWQNDALQSITDTNTTPNRTYKYEYDDEKNLISVENPIGDKRFYNYSLANRMVSVIDERALETLIIYSEVGAVTRISSCISEMRFSFVAASRETFVTQTANGVDQLTTYRFDEAGNLIQQVGNCCGFNTTYEYDEDKNISKVIDANGAEYTFIYDDKGNLLSETDPLGNSVAYTYHTEFSFVETITDKRGNETTFTYDNDGNLTQLQKPAGITELFTYDANGNLTSYTDGTNNLTTLTYDNNGQVTKVTYPTGTETIGYDNVGNMSIYTDANQNSVAFTYDALDRIISATDDLGNTQTYDFDPLGNITTLTDANSHTQQHSYDFLNRLTQVQIPVATYNYDYDQAGNLTAVKDGNNHSSQYEYDDRNLLIAETDAEDKVTRYEYDGNGNLTLRTDANGKTTQYTYDALNRLGSKTYDGNTDTYTYDENGNMTQSANNNITIDYGYDAANRLISKTMVEWNKTISYTYDAADNRTSMTDPDGGVTNYTYDNLNRLTQLQNPSGQITGFIYDDANRLTRQNNGNGTYTLHTYDDADRVLSIFHHRSNASIISGFTYTYDNKGNRLTTNEHGVGMHTYTYDASDRLLSVNYPDGQTESFTYDAAGNRTQSIRNGVTTNYTYDSADRLINAGEATYTFDDNGNMTQKTDSEGTTTYQYDGEDRIISVSLPNEDVVVFSYDPFGNRLVSNSDGLDTKYVLDGVNTLVELDDGNATQTRYTALFDYDSWINMEKNGASFQYHPDAIGSIRNLTNQSEDVENYYNYYAFGEVAATVESFHNSIQFSGRELNNKTELYYSRARYYNYKFGRFLTKDLYKGNLYSPLSTNRFNYVQSNPINYIDPSGLATVGGRVNISAVVFDITIGVHGDDKGNCITTFSYGFGLTYGAGINGGYTITNAPSVNYLTGEGWSVGMAASVPLKGPIGIGGEINAVGSIGPNKYVGLDFGAGVSAGFPITPQAFYTNTTDISSSYDLCPDEDDDDNEEGNQEGPQPNSNGEASCTVTVGSFDPNEIEAPPGVGPERWIPKGAEMPYTILYENDPEFATAPAQIVTITQDIDPELDPKSFRLGGFGFGFFEFDVPANISHYETRIENTVDSLEVMVDVEAGVDFAKNQLYWKFTAIDPATGFLTNDPFGGFLPVNDTLKRGEGFLTYTIRPKSDAKTLDEITAQASNVFDFNDPVLTNIETNTIDADPPTSNVQPITSAPNANNLLVTWQGNDVGSGVGTYDIYVSIDGGNYTKWQTNTPQTSALFPAVMDQTYCFISVAKDKVGNIQPLPSLCETMVTFTEDLLENCSSAGDLMLNQQPIVTGTYRSPQRITSNGLIDSAENVVFIASESITLEVGFTTKSGVEFLAMIENCTNEPQQLIDTTTYRFVEVNENSPEKNTVSFGLTCIPNPVYQTATISYQLPKASSASLSVYNSVGKNVLQLFSNKECQAGTESIGFNTEELKSGFYFLNLHTEYSQEVIKIIIIK